MHKIIATAFTAPLIIAFYIVFGSGLSAQSFSQEIHSNLSIYEKMELHSPFSVKERITDLDDGERIFLSSALTMEVDESFFDEILNSKQRQLRLEMPISERLSIELHLREVDVFSSDAVIKTSSGDEINPSDHDFRTFWGVVEGSPGSKVSFNVYADRIMAFISFGMHDFTFGKYGESDNAPHILYYNQNLDLPFFFSCGVDKLDQVDREGKQGNHSGSRALTDCVNIYVEADYDLYQEFGTVSGVIDHVTGLFSQVFIIFDDESIAMDISELLVWDTPSPYSGSDAEEYLLDFTDELDGNFNGDLAHLVNLEFTFGGVAWVNVLCFDPLATAFSGITNNYQNVPTYSYSVFVVAHEIGHNLGSEHTHACVWNNNDTQIDDCGNEFAHNQGSTPEGDACFNPSSPIIPTNGGTIMSYCNLFQNVGINFNLGFGSQPGDLIRGTVNSANCLGPCAGFSPPLANFSADPVFVCAPMDVFFIDLSENDPTSWEWDFPGGTPSSSQEQNPVITYETPGVYDVSLEVVNSDGVDVLLLIDFITVEENPEANFDFTADGLSVWFENLAESPNVSYFWDFGDGNSSTEASPFHEYAVGGIYEVSLLAFNDCGDVQSATIVEVFEAPEANFTADVETGCAPLEVQFQNQSTGGPEFFEWVFEGGNPDTTIDENPLVTYEEPGIYSVKLTVTNAEGSSTLEIDSFITVLGLPVAVFEIDSMDGRTYWFQDTSHYADSVHWVFGDTTISSNPSPVYEFENDGVYELILIAFNECGSDTLTTEIEVITPPVAAFEFSDTSGCAPLEVEFINLSSANTDSVLWHFPGGDPGESGMDTVTVTYAEGGWYEAVLVAFGQGGIDTLVMDSLVFVQTGPGADFEFEVDGDTVHFSQTVENETGWLWNFGDGNTSNENNPTHIYDVQGAYEVSLTVFNKCDTVEIIQQLSIGDIPVANFEPSTPVTGCLPLTVEFENLSSDHAESFEWFFEGGNPATSTDVNPTVAYENEGVFSVVLVASNFLGADTLEVVQLVEINDKPQAVFDIFELGGREFQFESTSLDADSLHWDMGDGTTFSSVEEFAYEYEESGIYDVVLIAINECGADTAVVEILISNTIEVGGQTLNVFPNPALDWINVEFELAPVEDMYWQVFDASGKLVRDGQLTAGETMQRLDLSGLSAGSYFLRLGDGEQAETVKIQLTGY